ncbi:GNAT family N-acetyltransferase [Bradyrhizobium sp. 157]|uniref:GNAT family N-acetyltransferase n=1 Tax=Bradyrhizobium sp. 157 TaxID=2782631 RepID=UPI001FF77D48|nr:GNAT family N-acetyltransferase [Bradyrhizobium sp. 157]
MPDIVVTDVIASCAIKAIDGSLEDFIDITTETSASRPLAVVLRDPETQRVLGGAIGCSSLELLFLDLFFLPEEFRVGWGTKILRNLKKKVDGVAAGRRSSTRSVFWHRISTRETDG